MAELIVAVRAALEALPLTPADTAAAELALTYAEQIEAGIGHGGGDATKALYLGPHLLATLTALGATPAGRKGAPPVVSATLARLRAERSAR